MDVSNTALVTHQGCMDGSTCALLFLAAGGRRENIHFCSPNHRDVDEKVKDLLENWSGPILLADISISQGLAAKVNRADICLLDHHLSALPLTKYRWCEIEEENLRCGSMMLYHYLESFAETRPLIKGLWDLVEAVDDHDRWVRTLPHSDELAMLHEILSQEFFIDRFMRNQSVTFSSNERYCLDLEKLKRDKYIASKKKNVVVVEKEFKGNPVRFGFVHAGTYQSLLGNQICEDPQLNVDVAVLVGTSISLRARKGSPVDLSVVAKLNGGGGHLLAAGCSLDRMLGKNLVDFVIENLKVQ
jgi:oligoribonuclease NrnB/cAMP/cGMP phosphodiesterase (DHH superfamily)